MGVIQLPDELRQIIERQVAEGRAGSQSEFIVEAVQRYADMLDFDQEAIVAAADDGLADMASGRFTMER